MSGNANENCPRIFLVFLEAHTAKCMGKLSLLGSDQQWLQIFTSGFVVLQACLNEEMSNYKYTVNEMKGLAGVKSQGSKSC